MPFKAVLLVALVALVGCLITSRSCKLYDNEGRQIIFHGPNVVVKIPPYSPITEQFDV
jgi:hypothetical protein